MEIEINCQTLSAESRQPMSTQHPTEHKVGKQPTPVNLSEWEDLSFLDDFDEPSSQELKLADRLASQLHQEERRELQCQQ